MSVQPRPSRPLLGIFWMAMSGFCFVGVYIGVRYVGTRLPAAESAFLRYLLGLVFVLPFIPSLWREGMSWANAKRFAARGFIHTFAVTLWFFAMARLAIAEVSAMGYLSPVWVTIGAVVFLGERLAIRRIMAIVVAIFGVLIILRPGFREIELGHLAMLGTAVCFGGSYLLAKETTRTASPSMVVAMLSITVTIGLIPLTIPVWIPPTTYELTWLFAVAAFATAGHYSMTFAFANAPLTVTQPVTFLQLVWSVSAGFLFFGEAIDFFVILGGSVIVISVVYITLREAKLRNAS